MPELPEVETICRGLAAEITGLKIVHAEKYRGKIRNIIPEDICEIITGQTIIQVKRKAKYIVIELSNDHSLVFHLGMSGKLLIYNEVRKLEKHDHFEVKFLNDKSLIFNDPRRFGLVDICETKSLGNNKNFANLGAEPLEKEFDEKYLKNKLSNKIVPIKLAIMDAKIVVGVGNIYASESLFKSGINPKCPAKDVPAKKLALLVCAIKEVLQDAINSGGSTLRDYVGASGDVGGFQHKFNVYGRHGKECFTCGEMIEKIVQGGRSSFYCPSCQK